MFQIGEYVVYGIKGVCLVENITHMDISGVDKERLYYVLAPVGESTGKIYAPTDHCKVMMRRIITKEEAKRLMEELPQIELLGVSDEREREAKYKEALNSCDYRRWVSIVKTLYVRGQERVAQGKKITALDERYMRTTENELYSELALTLEVPREKLEHEMRERLVQG